MQPVFVGDVQGCGAELEALVARLRKKLGDEFELLCVGDLINRGPQNLRALTLVRELQERGRARVVLGNHEIAFLRSALGERPIAPLDTFQEILERSDLDDWVEWLRRQPLVCTGRLGRRKFAMVHAAVPAGTRLAELEAIGASLARKLAKGPPRKLARFLARKPGESESRDTLACLTSCRTIQDGRWSPKHPDENGGRPWHESWSDAKSDYGVVYGHWSLQGLHVAPGLRGLDTGCVHHGRGRDGYLTAWIPDLDAKDPFAVPDERFERVRAFERYWREPAA